MAYNSNRDNRRGDESQPEFTEKVVSLNRVSKTVKGGRIFKFSALCVVGDGKGRVALGLARRAVSEAIRKGIEDAKKNITTVTLSGNTIPTRLGEFEPERCSSSPLHPVPALSPAALSVQLLRQPESRTSEPRACVPTIPRTLLRQQW